MSATGADAVPGPSPDVLPTFVFQHGLGADAAQPAALVPTDARVRVATLDCPGHGASPHGYPAGSGRPASDAPGPRAPSIAAFSGDVLAFAEGRIARAPWILGGISMGAAIALRLACRAVARGVVRAPAALVLVRPAWLYESAPPNMAPFVALADALRRHGPERGAEAFARGDAFDALQAASPDNAASLLAQFRRPQAIAYPGATADLLETIALDGPGVHEADVRAIRLPTLVVGCQDDAVHPLDCARRLAATIPGARLVEVASKSREPERHATEVRNAIGELIASVSAGG